ncbi:nitroreductase family protein [Candidatus Micrarchaeota archaeon]|jgi:nitroreductase|nr:nitroreductase family protein [Candidatus Micrarchaeota archaeon]
MNLDKVIDARYSVRKFKSDEIPDDLIKKLINVARLAPTARNTQSQKIYIINSNDLKDKLKKEQAFKQDFVYTAPSILICAVDPTPYPDPEERGKKFAIIDCTISSTFLVLKATELGLGTCYVGVIDENKIKQVLDIPDKYLIPFVIPIGYPDIKQGERKRKPLEEFYEKI